MKRVARRARALLALVAAAAGCLALYVYNLAAHGGEWVSLPANKAVYSAGVLRLGTVLDRDGVLLSGVSGGARTYSDSRAVRQATLHAVGDLQGNIATGALSAFAPQLMGYDFAFGVYSRTGGGGTVRLTIDSDLNVAAMKALAGRKGAVGVMNYRTGEMLCMVSSPSFDPLDPPDEVESGRYEGVYINRLLSAAYTPGSTFKLVTLAAAVENIPDLGDRVFSCSGKLEVGGDVVRCPKRHGEMSIEDALAVSCNCAFAELALELGGKTLAEYAERFGLTRSLLVDGIATAAGNFTAAADGTADLAWSGIGQYEDTVCPAAMLRLVAAIANGGVAPEMHLLARTGLSAVVPSFGERIMSAQTADRLAGMMSYNVYKTYGEGNFPGLEMHAKSGTAEVGGERPPHAWFVGFITNKDFPLAFAVVVENGGSGSQTAGEVANKVLQAAVSGKAGR